MYQIVLNVKETIERKNAVWLILTKQVQETRTSFYQLIKQKDAKGEVATKKCRSWNSCWATRLFFKDLSSIKAKQKLCVMPLYEIYMFSLKCYLQTNHFGLPQVNRPELWENLQGKINVPISWAVKENECISRKWLRGHGLNWTGAQRQLQTCTFLLFYIFSAAKRVGNYTFM